MRHSASMSYTFWAETGMFRNNKIDTMAADALVPCVARPLAVMELSLSSNDFNYMREIIFEKWWKMQIYFHIFGAKPLSKPMLGYCQMGP